MSRGHFEKANVIPNSGGPDLIKFTISGDGPHTMQPNSQLPTISQPVTIDGYPGRQDLGVLGATHRELFLA